MKLFLDRWRDELNHIIVLMVRQSDIHWCIISWLSLYFHNFAVQSGISGNASKVYQNLCFTFSPLLPEIVIINSFTYWTKILKMVLHLIWQYDKERIKFHLWLTSVKNMHVVFSLKTSFRSVQCGSPLPLICFTRNKKVRSIHVKVYFEWRYLKFYWKFIFNIPFSMHYHNDLSITIIEFTQN